MATFRSAMIVPLMAFLSLPKAASGQEGCVGGTDVWHPRACPVYPNQHNPPRQPSCDAYCLERNRELTRQRAEAHAAEAKRREALREERRREKARRKAAITAAATERKRQAQSAKLAKADAERARKQAAQEDARAAEFSKQADKLLARDDLPGSLSFYQKAFEVTPTDELADRIDSIQARIDAANNAEEETRIDAQIHTLETGVQQRLAEADQRANGYGLAHNIEVIQPATGSAFFGQVVHAPLPELAVGALPIVKAGTTLQDLSNIDASNRQAAEIANSSPGRQLTSGEMDRMKALSNCGFDTSPCVEGPRTRFPHPVQTPAASDLAAKVPPAAKDNPEIQRLLHDYDSNEERKQDNLFKLAQVEKQIKSSAQPDPELDAYHAKLVEQAAASQKQQQDDQSAIQQNLVNLGLNWVEEKPGNSKPQ